MPGSEPAPPSTIRIPQGGSTADLNECTSTRQNQVNYKYNYGQSGTQFYLSIIYIFLTAVMGLVVVSLFKNASNPTFTNSQINAHITNVQGRTGAYYGAQLSRLPLIIIYESRIS